MVGQFVGSRYFAGGRGCAWERAGTRGGIICRFDLGYGLRFQDHESLPRAKTNWVGLNI